MKICEFLTDESKWCKIEIARDKDDEIIAPKDPRACKWCLVGLVAKCYEDREEENTVYNMIYKFINKDRLHPISLGLFNDTSHFEDIKRLVRELDI